MSHENSEERVSEIKNKSSYGVTDMILCAGITAACSVLGFDGLFTDKAMLPLRIIAIILLIINWICASFYSGKSGKKSFGIFIIIYWIIPTVIYIFSDFSAKSSEFLDAVESLCKLLTILPFAFISEILGLPEWFFACVTLILSAAVFKFSYSYFCQN